MTAQQTVANAVEARGYFEGWQDDELMTRQLLKMIEEVAELCQCVTLPRSFSGEMELIGAHAREDFDEEIIPVFIGVDTAKVKEELADVLVTVFCAADRIAKITGQPYDVIEAAVEKATADVKRGVR